MEKESITLTGARALENIVVTNSYLVDMLRTYCEDNSNIDELSAVESILGIISERQAKALSLVSEIN